MGPSQSSALLAAALGAAALIAPLARAEGPAAASQAMTTLPCMLRWALRDGSDQASCIGCHDSSPGRLKRHAGANHEIGVAYQEASAHSALHLRPAAELPAGIVLMGGRLACTTCHDGASKTRGKVAAFGKRPSLCVACHDM